MGKQFKSKKVNRVRNLWFNIKQRCYNRKSKYFKNYGGRGIKLSKKWFNFKNFLNDVGFPPSKFHSLDRIDNNGNYTKSNCRWATNLQQARNSRSNIKVTIGNRTLCLSEWCEVYNLSYTGVYQRIAHRKWSAIRALHTPIETRKTTYKPLTRAQKQAKQTKLKNKIAKYLQK